mmetsp:Transcript_8322/g.12937  ORF Transcript_8322/g.12937 Transcript_8322/m.12937 type:complete len:322 (-) Transcript_8322:256-1221(-)
MHLQIDLLGQSLIFLRDFMPSIVDNALGNVHQIKFDHLFHDIVAHKRELECLQFIEDEIHHFYVFRMVFDRVQQTRRPLLRCPIQSVRLFQQQLNAIKSTKACRMRNEIQHFMVPIAILAILVIAAITNAFQYLAIVLLNALLCRFHNLRSKLVHFSLHRPMIQCALQCVTIQIVSMGICSAPQLCCSLVQYQLIDVVYKILVVLLDCLLTSLLQLLHRVDVVLFDVIFLLEKIDASLTQRTMNVLDAFEFEPLLGIFSVEQMFFLAQKLPLIAGGVCIVDTCRFAVGNYQRTHRIAFAQQVLTERAFILQTFVVCVKVQF